MRRLFLVPRLIAVAAVLVLAGCVTPAGDRSLLAFLADGKTTRSEVVERLGEPSAQLRADRILTFRIEGNEEKGYAVVSRASLTPTYSLVLVFDEAGTLQRHGLVKVR